MIPKTLCMFHIGTEKCLIPMKIIETLSKKRINLWHWAEEERGGGAGGGANELLSGPTVNLKFEEGHFIYFCDSVCFSGKEGQINLT